MKAVVVRKAAALLLNQEQISELCPQSVTDLVSQSLGKSNGIAFG